MPTISESAPTECAVCGAPLARTARACPECGADERTGWREVSVYDGIDLPDDPATADKSTRRRPGGLPWYWLAAAALLLFLLGFSALGLL
ncbi:hypothetical protein MASR2M8_12610 [Opitutaceae bacterium]